MADAIFHRSLRRHERLADHLPAKDPLPAVLRRVAPENIDFKGLKIEQPQELCDFQFGHGANPLDQPIAVKMHRKVPLTQAPPIGPKAYRLMRWPKRG
jgi:hypothetical protein